MPSAVDSFGQVANAFSEPILLVSSTAQLCAANLEARKLLLNGAAPRPDEPLFRLVTDTQDKVLDYLRMCSRSAQPLPGMLSFRKPDKTGSIAAYRCAGSVFSRGDRSDSPLVMLRLVPRDHSNRFVALNQQIDQLKNEIARRRTAERAAQEQRELLHVTLFSIGDAVITCDVESIITFMNPVAESLTGWSVTEALGRRLHEVFVICNEESREPVESPVDKVLRTGAIAGLANHTVLVRKDGSEVPIDDSGAPIRDAADHLLGVVLVFHDISERRRLQVALMDQARRLSETDRLKDEFLAMLAHELRNPLAPLKNCAQILRLQGSGATSIERLATMMDRQTNQLTRLVDDLLDVARITRGTISLKREPVLLSAAIEHAVESTRPLIEERRHRLGVSLPPETLIVDADPTRLIQIVSNLLNNAAKFTEPGGEISVAAWKEEDRAIISVRDTGIGLAPDSLTQVFELFRQENKAIDRVQGGLGIGLSLVKKLLEMHSGDIAAYSEGLGRGAEFRFWLPVTTAVPRPRELQQKNAQTKLRVLIVDDNTDAADTLGVLLDAAGCEVRLANDGPGAIEAAAAFKPQIVLLDIGLPGMDGYEVVRRLRSLPNLAALSIVAVTGYGSETDRARSREAGFDFHLTKPVDMEKLNELLAL